MLMLTIHVRSASMPEGREKNVAADGTGRKQRSA